MTQRVCIDISWDADGVRADWLAHGVIILRSERVTPDGRAFLTINEVVEGTIDELRGTSDEREISIEKAFGGGI